MHLRHFTAATILLAAVAGGGLALRSAPPDEVAGSCQPVFKAQVCTWARVVGSHVVALGATVPMAAIEGGPADMAMAWPPVAEAVIPLPAVAQHGTGVDHLTVFWEAHGHSPATFMVPHFDFHFYVIGDSARQAIDCKATEKPATLPAGYLLPDQDVPGLGTLIGICVPQMGMHATLAADAQSPSPMTSTMVLGYYHTVPIFFEPMISEATLQERKTFTLKVVAPGGAAAGVKYPTLFEAQYDATIPGGGYRFVFTGF